MLRPQDQDKLRQQFQSAQPFPHVVIDNFLQPEIAAEIAQSYPTFATAKEFGFAFNAVNEQKKVQVTESARFPDPVRRLNDALASPKFLQELAYITGIPNLIADVNLAGGGMHITGPGGRLDVHVDFNYDAERALHRRLNILVYLNPVWEPAWGGEIELWDEKVKNCGARLLPIINRCLIFRTNETSYHGVRPVMAPDGLERKSFAAYYYTREAPESWTGQAHSTVFRARPEEFVRGFLLMPAERLKRETLSRYNKLKKRVKRILVGTD